VWFAVAASAGFNSTHANYSHIAWYGNGCVINLTSAPVATIFGLFQYGAFDPYGVSPYYGGEDFVIDGFSMPNVPPSTLAFYLGVDHYTTLPISGTTNTSNGLLQKIRNVRLSRLFYTVNPSGFSGTPDPLTFQGAWHDILMEDCSFDSYGLTGSGSNCGGLFVRANAGDSEQLVVRRCYFRTSPLSQPLPVQIQANSSVHNGSMKRICQQVYVEDCTFDSGESTVSGYEVSINDTGGNSSNSGFVTNIEFRRCTFIVCGVSLVSNGNYFGYLRFMDCITGTGSTFPTPSSGSLGQRFPMAGNFGTITVSGNPFPYINVDAVEEIVVVVGGSVSAIVWGSTSSGTPTGLTSGTFRLRPGDSITVTYSTAPSMYKFAV
jgi:hypothetical protein